VSTRWLAVEPLDTVMVRDGRRFDAGVSGRAACTSPPPSTLGGALHTALGDAVDEVLGVVVQTRFGSVFPAPADLVVHRGRTLRLPVTERGSEAWDLDSDHRLSHQLAGDGEPLAGGWLTQHGLEAWLRGASPLQPGSEIGPGAGVVSAPWLPEQRLGLAREWEGELAGTASPGLLYTMAHLRPRHDGMRFLVPFRDERDVAVVRDLLRLGGRGRLAQVELVEPDDDVMPPPLDEYPNGRVAVYLATPALLGVDPDAPHPEAARSDPLWAPANSALCALANGGPVPIATASDRKGNYGDSRQLAWAVPAGTVFFLDFGGDAAAALAWAREHHGRLLPGLSNSPLRTAGFGMCLTGSW